MTKLADSVANKTTKPWWRYGLAWLVFGAPAAGVVAGLIVLYLAVVGQDSVLNHEYYENTVDAVVYIHRIQKDLKESQDDIK